MGNSGSKSYDAENCNDANMGDGCVEMMDSDNVVGIKNCKMNCLKSWTEKLKDQRDLLKENIINLERKLKILSESTDKVIADAGF